MSLKIEGGQDWVYYDGKWRWQPITSIPPEHLQSADPMYLSANGSKDLISVRPNKDGADISVYRLLMEGSLNVEAVELIGAVNPQQTYSTMSYKLGPGPAALHFSYRNMERLIISVNGLVNS